MMKSSRTKPASSTSFAAATQPVTSQRTASTLTATPSTSLSTSLRNPSSVTSSTLRSRVLNNSSILSTTGRKSPGSLRSDFSSAKTKRPFVNSSTAATAKVDGTKSMKKHFLSKSNDSLSGASGVTKKAKSQQSKSSAVAPPPLRGIRHPVVHAAGNNAASAAHVVIRKDKEPPIASTSTPAAVPVRPSDAAGEQLQREIRRSVSSNCLDVPALLSSHGDEQRRLSIPDVNRMHDIMPTVSHLNSNLAPSQPGIALVSTASQTEVSDESRKFECFDGQPRRRSGVTLPHVDSANREFQSLLDEHSEMSRQLSELCKVDPVLGMSSMSSEANLSHMDAEMLLSETDGSCLNKSADWDAQSNNSLCSEPSLACLQDRIQQMEETHHSTHEELQATLQELSEMGDYVSVCRKENEELAQEKAILQETLCAMTEKVQVYQTQAESLKKLLYRQAAGDENSVPETGGNSVNEKEKTLVDLMSNLQEEKEDLQHQLDGALEQNLKLSQEIEEAHIKLQNLDNWCDQMELQKKESERLLNVSRDAARRYEMETARLTALLETERNKVTELQTVAKMTAKADLEELLGHVRGEKERIDEQLASAKDRVRVLENDLENSKELHTRAEQNAASVERNLTTTLQDYKQRLDSKELECKAMAVELSQLKKDFDDLETQARLQEQENVNLQESLDSLRTEYSDEQNNWQTFQADLLTAVRVANDFRTECEIRTKSVSEDNQQLKRKMDDLTSELERMKAKKAGSPAKIVVPELNEVRARLDPVAPLLRSPSEREPVTPRLSRMSANHPISVKSLVQNMESNMRQGVRVVSIAGAVGKLTGIRKRDDNIVRSDSNSSLDSTDKQLDGDKYLDDEPSMPGDGLKPILSSKRVSLSSDSKNDTKDSLYDPLGNLAKGKGSKRNALLKWCQEKTLGYSGIDITNFSSSWNDGLAFCALIHSYLSDRIPYKELDNKDKRRNFALAFEAAKSVGVVPTLEINDLLSDDRPDWRAVMDYVISIYKHFEM